MLSKVEGIVIRATDYGEGNRILSVFTREMGRQSMMARGAKKVKSRLAALSQPFTYAQFIVFKSSPQAMGTINAGELIASHHKLREDLMLSAYAAYISELVNRLTEEGEALPALFEQLLAAFRAMEDGKDAAVIVHVMEMNMLSVAGFQPELNACVLCGGASHELTSLSVVHGGTVCARCRERDAQAVDAAPAVLKLLRAFQQIDLRRIGQIQVSDANKERVQRFIRSYMDAHLHARWKSRDLIDQLKRQRFDVNT
jgi:DNA repair protein RecO (recombination protein O)